MAERQDKNSGETAGAVARENSPANSAESIAWVFRNITPDSIIVKRSDALAKKTVPPAEPVQINEAGNAEAAMTEAAQQADEIKAAAKNDKPAVNMSFVTETAKEAATFFFKDSDIDIADMKDNGESETLESGETVSGRKSAPEKPAAFAESEAAISSRADAAGESKNTAPAPRAASGGSGFYNFMEKRLPVFSFFRRHICDFRVPANLNYFYTFGGILTLVLIAQILTGLVVAMHYVPSVDGAFASRQTLMRDVPFGWLFLPWHSVGASFFFIAAYIHLARGIYYGSHRAPRELVWIIGAAIYCVMMATAFFGYVLVWGMMSSSAATVITGLFKATPLIGSWLNETLIGGYSLGQPLLSRFYVLHFLFPFILLALVGLHIIAVHIVGQNNPTGRALPPEKTVPFVPYAAVKDILAIAVFLLFFCWFLFYMPDYMGHPDNFTQADILKTSPHIMPEWYFLPFYAMLKAMDFDIGFISSTLAGVIVLFAAIAVLFFIPWLDRSPVYSARYRPLYRLFYWLFIADTVLLGWLGACPPEAIYVHAAQAATAYYFAFFLIVMPFLPKLECRSSAYAAAAKAQKGGRQ